MLYKQSIAIIIPFLGGGTTRHAKEMAFAWSMQQYNSIYIEYMDRHINLLIIANGEILFSFEYWSEDPFGHIGELFDAMQITIIHIHHLLYAKDNFYEFLKYTDIPYVVSLHDYFTVCPFIKLVDKNGKYCGEKGLSQCIECIGSNLKTKNINIENWRSFYHDFLLRAKLIVVPSNDAKKRISNYFPDLNIIAVYNPEIIYKNKVIREKNDDREDDKKIKVGLIGILDETKGGSVLIDCASEAEKRGLPLLFYLFGEILLNKHKKIPTNIKVFGRYQEDQIYDLISKENIDYFWFPAQWPETYSYVLTIPVALKIPVLGTDLGAIAERIQEHGWGQTYNWNASVSSTIDALLKFDHAFYADRLMSYQIGNDSFPPIGSYYEELKEDKIYKTDVDFEKAKKIITKIKDESDITKNNIDNLSTYEFKVLLKDNVKISKKLCLIFKLNKKIFFLYFKQNNIKTVLNKLIEIVAKVFVKQ